MNKYITVAFILLFSTVTLVFLPNLFTGYGSSQPGSCSTNSDCGVARGSCWQMQCVQGQCQESVKPEGGACYIEESEEHGHCDGSGACINGDGACTENDDCAIDGGGENADCQTAVCNSGTCGVTYGQDGTSCSYTTAEGDAKGGTCKAGQCVIGCSTNQDCTDGQPPGGCIQPGRCVLNAAGDANECVYSPEPDRTGCEISDYNPCVTINAWCTEGRCTPHGQINHCLDAIDRCGHFLMGTLDNAYGNCFTGRKFTLRNTIEGGGGNFG